MWNVFRRMLINSLGLKGDSAAAKGSVCDDQILPTDDEVESAAAQHNCGDFSVPSCLRSLGRYLAHLNMWSSHPADSPAPQLLSACSPAGVRAGNCSWPRHQAAPHTRRASNDNTGMSQPMMRFSEAYCPRRVVTRSAIPTSQSG